MKYIIAFLFATIPSLAFAGNCHQQIVQQVVAQPVVTYVQPVRQVQFVQVQHQQLAVVQQHVVAQPVIVQQVKVQRVQQQRSVQRSRSVSRVGGIF